MAAYGQVTNCGHCSYERRSGNSTCLGLLTPLTGCKPVPKSYSVRALDMARRLQPLILQLVELKLKRKRMPTRITEIEKPKREVPALSVVSKGPGQPDGSKTESLQTDSGNAATVFKVEGTLYLKDAELLEKICRDIVNQTRRPVTLELAGLSYLDSESAAVLCRMKHEQGVRLEGLHLFIEKVVELAEECEKAVKYLPQGKDAA